ncbi:MAG TPA: M14 family metallopeptidase, partial [Terriglobia bacterium]|nr:M14 family metallopeptidase [Terriglobia bacterium]
QTPASSIELGDLVQSARQVLLGPDVRSRRVIDLAARIGLESTELRLPLVRVAREVPNGTKPPENAILIGLSNPYVEQFIRSGKFSPPVLPGTGSLSVVEQSVVIAGADAEGEAAAVEHAALRMPYLFSYGKGKTSIRSVEDEVRGHRPGKAPTAELIFDDTHSFEWEIDTARKRLKEMLLPAIEPGDTVQIDLRLSEPPAIRQEFHAELFKLLEGVGADLQSSSIRVLSAHKQGFCWIDEQLKPDLARAFRIRILVRKLECRPDSVDTEDRWLHELYPIDEVLFRDLGIPVDRIVFEAMPLSAEHVYEVMAEDADGKLVLHSWFDPTCIARPLFDVFPQYANATVATGWVRATARGTLHLNERIRTDYEGFWDHYQSKILPLVRDYVLKLHAGEPQPQSAPHFDELTIELHLSEPDYGIGIDEERISTLEALHEDIYFETLLFFEVLGLATCGKPLRYPGRIVPRVFPSRPGAGYARVQLTGYRTPFTTDTPFANLNPRAMMVAVNGDGLTSIEIFAGTRFSWLLDRSAEMPDIRRRPPSECVVQWDQPIGPEECEQIIGELASFPGVRPFPAGRSWLGHTVWAIDVTTPFEGRYFSQAKAIATKPCLFITGRQHANEVSSTSHILKLVESLATQPECRQLLNRVNFIIQPITNPDGAALVDDLHKLTPDFMLHAGYLGALGVDVTEEQWSNAPKYPEAKIRVDLWKMWQPDIVLNPHGYPSHEWVQLFAGYTAWVKSKRIQARDWWIPRGWFIPKFDFIEDDVYPHHHRAALMLRERISDAVGQTFGTFNERMYQRYSRYTGCTLELHGEVWIQSPTCGSKPNPTAFGFMTRHPDVTFLESLSEAPDEVASGDWLKRLAAVGLEADLAYARFLAELPDGVIRTRYEESGTKILRITRTRLASLP